MPRIFRQRGRIQDGKRTRYNSWPRSSCFRCGPKEPYFHTTAKGSGLGMSSLRQTVPVLRKQRLLKHLKSTDEAIRWVARTSAYSRHMKKVTRLSQDGGNEMVTNWGVRKRRLQSFIALCGSAATTLSLVTG